MIIERIDPEETHYLQWQSMIDDAHVTGVPLVERPWHYRHKDTGQAFYSLYSCVGWPTVIKTERDKATARPGYLAVVGVLKGKRPPEDAYFQILEEAEAHSVQRLIGEMLRLRGKYGFGLHPDLLSSWYGDQERFIMELAARNDALTKDGKERNAIIINTPVNFYVPQAFDLYVRALTEVLSRHNQRLYYGGNDILKNRVSEYTEKDPVIIGMGGLVYSLLIEKPWLQATKPGIFNVEGDGDLTGSSGFDSIRGSYLSHGSNLWRLFGIPFKSCTGRINVCRA